MASPRASGHDFKGPAPPSPLRAPTMDPPRIDLSNHSRPPIPRAFTAAAGHPTSTPLVMADLQHASPRAFLSFGPGHLSRPRWQAPPLPRTPGLMHTRASPPCSQEDPLMHTRASPPCSQEDPLMQPRAAPPRNTEDLPLQTRAQSPITHQGTILQTRAPSSVTQQGIVSTARAPPSPTTVSTARGDSVVMSQVTGASQPFTPGGPTSSAAGHQSTSNQRAPPSSHFMVPRAPPIHHRATMHRQPGSSPAMARASIQSLMSRRPQIIQEALRRQSKPARLHPLRYRASLPRAPPTPVSIRAPNQHALELQDVQAWHAEPHAPIPSPSEAAPGASTSSGTQVSSKAPSFSSLVQRQFINEPVTRKRSSSSSSHSTLAPIQESIEPPTGMSSRDARAPRTIQPRPTSAPQLQTQGSVVLPSSINDQATDTELQFVAFTQGEASVTIMTPATIQRTIRAHMQQLWLSEEHTLLSVAVTVLLSPSNATKGE